MKEITKGYLQSLYDMGFSKNEMKARILEDFNAKVTTRRLETALDTFGMDMRCKPQRTDVIFVDDSRPAPSTDYSGVTIRDGYTPATNAKAFSVDEIYAGANHDDNAY